MSENSTRTRLQLVEGGTSVVEILRWRADETPVVEFAADELQRYVAEMSDATVPITTATVDTRVETIHSALALVPRGVTDGLETSDGVVSLPEGWVQTLDQTLTDTDPDGFTVTTLEDALVLAGSTHRGTLYAVYELLEELGVRFFAPGFEFYEGTAEYVPRRESIVTPPLDVLEEPSLAYRRKDIAEGRSHTAATIREMADWMAKTRLNVLATPADFTNLGRGVVTWDDWREDVIPALDRRGLLLEAGGHGFDAFLPPAEYEASHPEWFVEGYNVFDITDENAVETYIDNTVAYLEAHPEIDVFDAWPPDGADWPPRVSEAFGSIANAYAHVVNRLTAAVRDQLPDRTLEIEALAYASHIEVPDPEYRYDDATIIDFAPFDRSYADPIFEAESGMNRAYVEGMTEWRDAFDGILSTYEYYRKYSWHSLPVVLPDLIGREIPFYERIGLDGLWLYSEPADWLTYELTHLLVAALSWDASMDPDRYVKEYLHERYGPAAEPMGTYLEHVEHAGRTLFDSFRGNYDDEEVVGDAVTTYRRAKQTLLEARAATEDGSSAAFLLDRLLRNAEFAIADTELSHYRLDGRDEAATNAKQRARESVERHRFDGIVLKSKWTLHRITPEEDVPNAAELIEEYRREWGR